MHSDLPPDISKPLDYASMIETLKLLEGEEVCLFIDGGQNEGKASRIQAKGILRHYAYSWADGFALGDAARVLIYEPDFVGADLTTFEGTNFFRVSIELRDALFTIGDLALETDEFDLFP